MLREDSSCAEHCINCALTFSFSSSNIRKFSFVCSPIREQNPEKRCYLRLPEQPAPPSPRPQLHSVACGVLGLLSPSTLPFLPSLPSLLRFEHPWPLYPARLSGAQALPWIREPSPSWTLLLTIFSFLFSSWRNVSSSCSSNFSCSLLFFNCSRFSSSNLVTS